MGGALEISYPLPAVHPEGSSGIYFNPISLRVTHPQARYEALGRRLSDVQLVKEGKEISVDWSKWGYWRLAAVSQGSSFAAPAAPKFLIHISGKEVCYD